MGTAENVEERQIVCSACLQVVPKSLIHVIPYYNGDMGRYVTTHRCDRCWLSSLDETRARLELAVDETEIASSVEFFEKHGVFLHEFRRRDPIAVVRKMLVRMIDLLRSEAIRPVIGPLEPASEVRASTNEMQNYEKFAEAAYDAMYEAKSYSVKNCFDDARGYFTKAIDIAKRAGLDGEVAR